MSHCRCCKIKWVISEREIRIRLWKQNVNCTLRYVTS